MSNLNIATHIELKAGVRYWEDASVNGVDEDNDAPSIPLRRGEAWCPRIRLADGIVEDWPTGTTVSVHYKVCDAGLYWLTDAGGKRVAEWGGCYVPNGILCPGGNGYGDYIIMTIGSDGKIDDWIMPVIKDEDWVDLITDTNHG